LTLEQQEEIVHRWSERVPREIVEGADGEPYLVKK
jgi:hypothetical protein